VILAPQGRLLGRSFFEYSRGGYLVNSQLAQGVCIETLANRHSHALTLRSHQTALHQPNDASHVFVSLLSEQLNDQFNVLFIRLILESYFLVEDELIVGSGSDFGSDATALMFEVDSAGKLDAEG
jgi:hypothetical protein